MAGESQSDAGIVQKVVIAVVTLVVGLYLGKNVPSQPFFAVGLVAMFALMFLLFARPPHFILLLLFFLFEAFNLIDVDRFARIPGLFRAKDVLIALAIGYVIANISLQNKPSYDVRRSRLFKPLVIFGLYLLIQMWRTKVLLHESPMLVLRQGRHFLSYCFPLIIFFYYRTERDWRALDRFCLFFITLTTILNMIEVFIPIPFYHSMGGSTATYGVFKSYNPVGFLVYWFFFRKFWAFCEKPTPRSLVQLGGMGVAVMFYFGRGSVAGSLIGMALVSALVPVRTRVRAGSTLLAVGVFMIMLTITGVAFSQTLSMDEVADSFKKYFASTVTDVVRVEGTYQSRVINDMERYPLVHQHPFMGIGFLSVFGSVAYSMWKTDGVLPVGTVDTGWLDLMLRLGGIGTFLLLLLLWKTFRANWSLFKEGSWEPRDGGILLANMCLVAATVSSSIAGGALVWEPGIITVAICIAWTIKLERDAADRKSLTAKAGTTPAKVIPAGPSASRPFRMSPYY